jgi:adenine-specific DNA-methyltransferase
VNFKAAQTEQKLRGGYYTQPDIAEFLSRWVLECEPQTVLEPSSGDGVFIEALARLRAPIKSVIACELNPAEAESTRSRAHDERTFDVSVFAEDFLAWSLPRFDQPPQFDAVLGNPPFIRYQYLDRQQQSRAEQIFNRFQLPFTKHTNAWVPFVVAAIAQLRPGGRLAMVVPSELLHVLHARSLRHFLLRQCSKILVLDPDQIWFSETLQGVVLLLAEKAATPSQKIAEIAVVPVQDRAALNCEARNHFAKADYISGSVLNGKWMLSLLTRHEQLLLEQLSHHPNVVPFQEVATVDVGIVTGANDFFLVPDAIVEEYGLARWAHPMFGRSDHVAGVIYDEGQHEKNRRAGLRTNFLWFKNAPLESLPERARAYLEKGEAQGLNQRFKCRTRTPWYTVPSVYAAPIAMLKRSHNFPRLVLNQLKAFTTDTAYRVETTKVAAEALVSGFVNSLTALTTELEGRHYGGGVLELVPSEIEKVLVPIGNHDADETLLTLDKAIRSDASPEEVLARQDKLVLEPLGIGQADSEVLLNAWSRLRVRRQRIHRGGPEGPEREKRRRRRRGAGGTQDNGIQIR